MASLLTCKDLMIPRKGMAMPRKDSTILSPLVVVRPAAKEAGAPTRQATLFVRRHCPATCTDIDSSYANMEYHPSRAVTMPPDDIAHSLLPRARHAPSDFHPP